MITYSSYCASKEGRYIHTGLYSDRAFCIINAMFESLHKEYAYAKNTFKIKSIMKTVVVRSDDNEIVFHGGCINRWSNIDYAFSGWSDAKILEHIAWIMKCKVQKLIKNRLNIVWDRYCNTTFAVESENISIKEIYYIYDRFRNRKNIDKHYSAELRNSIIGKPLDPIIIECKVAQREEESKIKIELDTAISNMHRECRDKQNKAYAEIEEEYRIKIELLRKEAVKKIEKLNKELSSLGAAA